MRIATAHFYYHPLFSGAAIGFHNLAQEFVARGHEVTVFTPQYAGLPKIEYIDGVRVIRLPILGKKRLSRLITFALSLGLTLAKSRGYYDILHLHSFGPFELWPVSVARFLGTKVLYQITIMGSEPTAILRTSRTAPITRMGLKLVNSYAALTAAGLARISENSQGHQLTVVLPYGVDTNLFLPATPSEKRSLRKKLGLDINSKYICFVGSICERKGVDILIEAFKSIASQNIDVKLLLVGKDQYVTELFSDTPYVHNQRFVEGLKSSLKAENLQDRVIFTGLTDEVGAYLRAADFFVLPSRREGFGIVIIEAMASGLPCIVASLDGITADMLIPGKSGYIASRNEPDTYAGYILELLNNPEKADQLGQYARHIAIERFSLPNVANRYITHYAELLAKK